MVDSGSFMKNNSYVSHIYIFIGDSSMSYFLCMVIVQYIVVYIINIYIEREIIGTVYSTFRC